jgi:hypothetical protein
MTSSTTDAARALDDDVGLKRAEAAAVVSRGESARQVGLRAVGGAIENVQFIAALLA